MVRISNARLASTAEWDHYARECRYATFFQTPSWAKLWESYTNRRIRGDARVIEFSDGRTALLPFSCEMGGGGLLRKYLSSPAGTFGGWLSLDSLSEVHGGLLFRHILRNYRNLVWRVNPYNDQELKLGLKGAREDETQVIDLKSITDEDELKQKYKRSVRKQINKAVRNGFYAYKAESWNDWEKYFSIFQRAVRRWGEDPKDHYSLDLFRLLSEMSGESVVLWIVASRSNEIVGGNVNFYHRDHCVEWHASFLADYFRFGIRHLLVHHIVVDAWRKGYKWYDFNPSGGHEGVKEFKKTFGTVALRSPVIYTILENHPGLRMVRRMRRRLLEAMRR